MVKQETNINLDESQLRISFSTDDDMEHAQKALSTEVKVSKENNSSSFQWSSESTRSMLNARFQRQDKFLEHIRPKKDLWDEVATEMKASDYHVTGEMCDLKYRNMLQTYKKNRFKELRGMECTIAWEYYDMFKNAIESHVGLEDLLPSLLCASIVKHEDDESCDVEQAMDTESLSLTKTQSTDQRKRKRSMALQESNAANTSSEVDCGTTKTRHASSRLLQKRQRLSSVLLKTDETQTSRASPNTSLDATAVSPSGLVAPAPLFENSIRGDLSTGELQECRVFGESVGAQLSLITDSHVRALVQLKMQEILYAARVGKLIAK